NRNQHIKIKRTNNDVYNLKGIVYEDTSDHYNSFFIENDHLYDQESGMKMPMTILYPRLLIYELQE
ncbi:hypothetical protein M153_21720001, partial [Pseudoloma neurophilia]